jgi:hypothetical protein
LVRVFSSRAPPSAAAARRRLIFRCKLLNLN